MAGVSGDFDFLVLGLMLGFLAMMLPTWISFLGFSWFGGFGCAGRFFLDRLALWVLV